MDEICFTCLSKHRDLILLSSIEVISAISFAGSPVLVCWECSSRLHKMQAFKAQATKAQELLKLCVDSKEPLKSLRSLSSLSKSGTKTGYDENIVYCMKQETVEYDEELQSDVKYETDIIEHTPKAEIVETDINESLSKYLHVTVEHHTEAGKKQGNKTDARPVPEGAKKKVTKLKREIDVKKAPKVKKYAIKRVGKKLSMESEAEENFTTKMMSFEELQRLREEDRKNGRYLSYPFKCTSCITGYVLEEKYKAHIQLNHSEDIGPHTCDICLARHKTPELLSRHRETHLCRYHCRECPFNSHKLQWMLAHQTEHKKETFSCEICGFATFTEGRLRYHRNKTHKKRPTCQICSKEFSSGDTLKKHMRMMHGNVKLERCAICGGMYRFLRAHLRAHAPPARDACCVECGVSFKNKYTLKNHLSAHSKHRQQNDDGSLKFHVCDECGYRSTNKTNMDRHKVAQHTKQYPFSCDICHKGFYRRDKLKAHVLERHEGGELPRNKMCSYCGKAFKTKAVLINHIRTHTGERPFQCPHCPWSFAQRVTLRTHMRGLHPAPGTGNTGGVTGNTGAVAGRGNTQDGGEKSGKAARKSD